MQIIVFFANMFQMQLHLSMFLLIIFIARLHGTPFDNALIALSQDPHGFVFVDLGISEEDLLEFQQIDIHQTSEYNQFGELHELETKLFSFLNTLGANPTSRIERLHTCLLEIVDQVILFSGEETAFICLRAFRPTTDYDLGRWHLDGYYFTPRDPNALMYKLVLTLAGPSTLFYPLPPSLRHEIWPHMPDRMYMHTFCQSGPLLSAKRGEGCLFLGGTRLRAALHSEPPIHENRLFFSIVPCDQKQLIELQKKTTPLIVDLMYH
jgi:hypothetical protein